MRRKWLRLVANWSLDQIFDRRLTDDEKASVPGLRAPRSKFVHVADRVNSPNGFQPEPNTMKDVIRVVLVDPQEESRASMQRMLVGITTIWLSEVLTSYQEAAARAKEIAGYLTIVSLDHDTNRPSNSFRN